MSSEKWDLISYFDDTSDNESETPFIPVRAARGSDSWTRFFGGLLTGIFGGALVPLAPWLAGALIFAGYGVTAYTLSGSSSRFTGSLCFGFAWASFAGLSVLLADVLWPETASFLVDTAGRHLPVFLVVLAMPWTITIGRYVFAKRKSPRKARSASRPGHTGRANRVSRAGA